MKHTVTLELEFPDPALILPDRGTPEDMYRLLANILWREIDQLREARFSTLTDAAYPCHVTVATVEVNGKNYRFEYDPPKN